MNNQKSLAILLAAGFFALLLVGAESTPPPPECSDGVDNDGDGDIDGLDMECFFMPTPSPGDTEPPTAIYCPNWNDENNPPMSLGECA